MGKIKYQYLLFVFTSLFLLSCDNSTLPLKDGFTVYGTVINSINEEKVDSVLISLGFKTLEDSLYFTNLELVSDKMGKFVYKGGIGTAPSDEILRFEHKTFYPKNVFLAEEAYGHDGSYTLLVKLQPK